MSQPWTPEREQRLREVWQSDMSRQEIADAFGVSRDTIQKRANRMGLTRRSRFGLTRRQSGTGVLYPNRRDWIDTAAIIDRILERAA